MSHFLLMVDRMRSPLVSIDEQAFLIPERRSNEVLDHRRNLSLDRMAGELDVSPEHLARAFRRRTGETVFGYLQSLRLDDAKTLLVGSELSIAETAAATSFSSPALFSRTFQKRFGLSPRRYRQRIWESAQENFVPADARV